MGESFRDYSQIQDFEADFPHKVSLNMLNWTDFNSFSGLFSVYLLAIDHLNLKLLTLCRHTASFKSLRIFEILNFHQCTLVEQRFYFVTDLLLSYR